jgi:hypothetical protein
MNVHRTNMVLSCAPNDPSVVQENRGLRCGQIKTESETGADWVKCEKNTAFTHLYIFSQARDR